MRGSTLCHAILAVHADGAREEGIVSKAAAQKLHDTTELDYMTHIVLRMYENKKCAPVPMHVPVITAEEPAFCYFMRDSTHVSLEEKPECAWSSDST